MRRSKLKTLIMPVYINVHVNDAHRVVLRNYPDVSGEVHQLVIYDLPEPMGLRSIYLQSAATIPPRCMSSRQRSGV